MKENSIMIVDENGQEKEMTILLTIDDPKKIVVCYDEKDEESLYAFEYDDDGNLFVLENEDDIKMIEEVIEAYEEEE